MKIHDCRQGDEEWLRLRLGKVTASEFGNIVKADFTLRDGQMLKSYLYAKLAEKVRGQPLPGFSSFATEQGQMREDEARSWYAWEFDNEQVRNVGFCESDDGRSGCSPDALIGEDGGLELKCPEPVNHLRYLLEGKLPADYAPQVHGSLFVTGRPWWKFVSYSRGFPPFVLKVERDERIMEKIALALSAFDKLFDDALDRLTQLQAAL